MFLLLVGWAKTHRDINGYISFLNTTDWSVFHRSQPATRADPFWPSPDAEVSIEDMLDTEEDVDILNAFDPTMEDELDNIATDEVTLEEEDFGFVVDESHNATSEEDSTIQQFIEQRK